MNRYYPEYKNAENKRISLFFNRFAKDIYFYLSIIFWNVYYVSDKTLTNSISPEEVSSIFEHTKEQLASLLAEPHNRQIVTEISESLRLINDFFLQDPMSFDNSTLCLSDCKIISYEHKVYYKKFYNSYFYGYWNVVYKGKGIYIFDIKEGEEKTKYFGISFFDNGEKYVGYFKAEDKEDSEGLYIWNNDEWYVGGWYYGHAHNNGFYYNKNETYKGVFEYSQPKGKGLRKLSNGSIIDGNIKEGLWTGSATLYFSNGDTYQGPLKDNKADGSGKYLSYSINATYEGLFNNGLRKDLNKWYRDCKGNTTIGKQSSENKFKIEFDTKDEQCRYNAILEDPEKIIGISKDIGNLPLNKNRPLIRNRSN